jgi:hypothetical protein
VGDVGQDIEDVSPEEMQRRLGDPTFTKAMEYVAGAEVLPAGQLVYIVGTMCRSVSHRPYLPRNAISDTESATATRD